MFYHCHEHKFTLWDYKAVLGAITGVFSHYYKPPLFVNKLHVSGWHIHDQWWLFLFNYHIYEYIISL